MTGKRTRRLIKAAIAFLALLLSSFYRSPILAQAPQSPVEVHTRGILVGAPKVYDDYYLQTLLASLKSNLTSIQAVNQTTLTNSIGNTQGGDLREFSTAVSASGPPSAGTSNFTLAPGVPAFMVPTNPSGATTAPTATAAGTAPGTTTTVNSVVPTSPTAPAPTLTMPSFAQSSLGTLNESLQLAAEIMNVQLLLDGALSDRLQRSTGRPRSTYSIGFPVTIDNATAADKKHENQVAEIRIEMCPATVEVQDPPSIVTLLPKERTYNVASLVDKSFLGSVSALLGGVSNIGGSFLFAHKTFYLVQQQETVAYQNPASRVCPMELSTGQATDPKVSSQTVPAISFSWQIRPVLGSKHVRPGMYQEFVQVSFPQDLAEGAVRRLGQAWVTVCWHNTKDNGNLLVGSAEDSSDPVPFDIPKYDTRPIGQQVFVSDIGQGKVSVTVHGTFLPGVMVRVGGSILQPIVSSKTDSLEFIVAVKDLVQADGAFLISRGSEETHLSQSITAAGDPRPLTISNLTITPYSNSQALITIAYAAPAGIAPAATPSPDSAKNPWIVTIGDKAFGLRDNPFLASTPGQIQLLAPTDLVVANPSIELRRLLWSDQYFRAQYAVQQDQFPLGNPTASKVSTLSTANGLALAIVGSGLNNAMVQYPLLPGATIESIGPTYARITIPKPKVTPQAEAPPLPKQLVLCRKSGAVCDSNYLPLVLDVPKDDGTAAKPAPFKVTGPVLVTANTIKVSGDQVAKVAMVEFQKTQLSFQLSTDDKPSLLITLPSSIAGRPGTYVIVLTLDDKSTQVLPVAIKAP